MQCCHESRSHGMNLQALSWMQCCHASRTRALDKADARLCCFPEAWDVRVMSVYVHARARACVCVCVCGA